MRKFIIDVLASSIFASIYDKNIRNKTLFIIVIILSPLSSSAQSIPNPSTENWLLNPGVLGTVLLTAIVFFIAVIIVYYRLSSYLDSANKKKHFEKETGMSRSRSRSMPTGVSAVMCL